ncbi:MAG: metallophosphoesterase [Elusimicrobia bacterium]|nr:metallophosphoesterase [Elusimicrobiota bacterium]
MAVIQVSPAFGEGSSRALPVSQASWPPPGFKVAFVGDGNSADVLELIKAQGAHMLIHLGDFDYEGNPDRFERRINDILGPQFPYFILVGNHDIDKWSVPGGYQERFFKRLNQIQGASCTGDYGVNSACSYKGFFFVLSGIGTLGSGHEAYLREALAQAPSLWKVAAWHKNQTEMQVGKKENEASWEPYKAALEGGAIIATAHEHSYERTKTLVDMESPRVDPLWPDPHRLRVGPGATFAFVSGLGGKDIRSQTRCLPADPPYGCQGEWGKIYTSNHGAKHGVLFITFHVDGDPRKARGEYVNIDHELIDSFTIERPAEARASASVSPGEEKTLLFNSEWGPVRIHIPAGAFPAEATLSVTTPPNFPKAPSSQGELMNTEKGFEITASQPLSPAVRISVSMQYPEDGLSDSEEEELVLAAYDPYQNKWTAQPSSVMPEENRVDAVINHFSTFQMMRVLPLESAGGPRAFPNPCRMSKGCGFVTFAGLPDDARIRLFTPAGERVLDIPPGAPGVAVWDGKNESGQPVASGVYLALVESPQGRKLLKVAVLR